MKSTHTLLSIIVIIFLGCKDVIVPKETELERYPWMKVFTSEYTDFKGIGHNLDTGEYSFSFENGYDDLDTYFKITDSLALENGWEITNFKEDRRTYRRVDNTYPAADGYEFVCLTLNDKNRITFFKRCISRKYIDKYTPC
ncbi:hypothetical protein LJC16_02525 [Bacteroidales bacterium OttesenSCG-928-C19]|nr:hypothetical protein [Bacteroidales bacterium OttesenSCG-928-C19]